MFGRFARIARFTDEVEGRLVLTGTGGAESGEAGTDKGTMSVIPGRPDPLSEDVSSNCIYGWRAGSDRSTGGS